MSVETSVFISYRRTNYYIARAVYQDLRANGYDVFLDFQNIDSGSFERVILNQIAARAHFLVVLTPSALERCVNPDDWVRREIEHAIEMKRNVVPLLFEDFDFQAAQPYLAGKLGTLPKYNAVRVPPDYFEEAMERMRNRFLNRSLAVILHPTPVEERAAVAESIAEVDQQPMPSKQQRSAESYFERGSLLYQQKEYQSALAEFTQALKLNPEYVHAFYYRGLCKQSLQKFNESIADYSAALKLLAPAYLKQNTTTTLTEDLLRPAHSWKYEIYYQRAIAYHTLGKIALALADYGETLRLRPPHVGALTRRGDARTERGDFDRAIKDYEETLKISPGHEPAKKGLEDARLRKREQGGTGILQRIQNVLTGTEPLQNAETAQEYYQRGLERLKKDYDGKIKDFTRAIRLKPDFVMAYLARAVIYIYAEEYDRAIQDLTRAITLKPDNIDAYILREGAYYRAGEFARAVSDCHYVLKRQPENDDVRVNRAESYLALGEAENALIDYERIQKAQHDSLCKAGMALAYRQKGNLEKAREFWQMLVNLDRRYRDAEFAGKKLKLHPVLIEQVKMLNETLK